MDSRFTCLRLMAAALVLASLALLSGCGAGSPHLRFVAAGGTGGFGTLLTSPDGMTLTAHSP